MPSCRSHAWKKACCSAKCNLGAYALSRLWAVGFMAAMHSLLAKNHILYKNTDSGF